MSEKIETIRCRAKLGGDCYDGSPMSRQMPGDAPEKPGDPPLMMSEDGTYDGESIVCDACYVKLCPLTKSGAACADELPGAIRLYHENVAFLRKQEDPAEFVERARRAMEMATPFSPYWSSAKAMKELAEAEVERRRVVA